MDHGHEEISLETRSYGSTQNKQRNPSRVFYQKKLDKMPQQRRNSSQDQSDQEGVETIMLETEPPQRNVDHVYGAIYPSKGDDATPCLLNANLNVAMSLSASTIHTDTAEDMSQMPMARDLEEDETCGWGLFRPRWCQKFRDPRVVLGFLCCAGIIQGIVINGLISVVISSIEKRFDLASKETGFIASSYDIASVLCLIPISYFGGNGHKPRWLGTGILFLGLGSFMFALPHFTTNLYNYKSLEASELCMAPNATAVQKQPVCEDNDDAHMHLRNYKYIFIIAQLLHGMGATPLYTLGVTYLDENLKPKVAPVYLGIYYSMVIIGPSIGYVLGGEMLELFCDVDKLSSDLVTLTPADPQWVGAWWIGFLVIGLVAIIMSLPILGFPRSLPGAAQAQAQRVSEVYRGSDTEATSNPSFGMSMKDIPASLKILLTNPTFMFLSCAGACEGLLVSGFIVFTPKFIESQFSLSAGWAAQIVGFATIPAGGTGTFLGGYLVKKLDLKCRGIIKLCLATTTCTLVLMLVFLVRCDNVSLAGVNANYTHDNKTTVSQKTNLTSPCNQACACAGVSYDPVCGLDGLMYFSPCHAGCRTTSESQAEKHKNTKVYSDCACVALDGLPHTATVPPLTSLPPGTKIPGATGGKCKSDCQLLAVFLPLFALIILITLMASMPALSATLRCVPEKQRSFALGIQWIIVRCLGTIPAPILFGTLIDKTCQLQVNACKEQGSCYFYDNLTMSHYLLFLALLCKGLSFLFFFLALFLYKAPRTPSKAHDFQALPGKTNSVNSTMHFLSKEQGQEVKMSPMGSLRSISETGELHTMAAATPKLGK